MSDFLTERLEATSFYAMTSDHEDGGRTSLQKPKNDRRRKPQNAQKTDRAPLKIVQAVQGFSNDDDRNDPNNDLQNSLNAGDETDFSNEPIHILDQLA